MQHQRRYEIGACCLPNAVSRGKSLTTAGEFHGRTNRSAGFSALPVTEPMGPRAASAWCLKTWATQWRRLSAVFPLQMLLAALLGWLEREQRDVIAFLREENRVLKTQLAGRRLRVTDPQRRRLAQLGQRLGRAVLRDVATLVTPDTIFDGIAN